MGKGGVRVGTADAPATPAAVRHHGAWRRVAGCLVLLLAALGVVELLRLWDAVSATGALAHLQAAYGAVAFAVQRALTP